MTRSRRRRPRSGTARNQRDSGFTLIELSVALLVLGIVLASLGPAFYDMMKATYTTNQRSVADGIAVGTTERLRSLPYYEVGYTTPPDYCDGANPVQLSYYTPVNDFADTQTVGTITYTIQTCIYWVQAGKVSGALYPNAYKESVVRVLWGEGNTYTYTQTSAIYPGGESSYASGGQQNFAPSSGVTAPAGVAPPTPTANSATDSALAPTSVIQVDWQPVTLYGGGTAQYIIEYWTGPTRPMSPAATPDVNGTSDGHGGLVYQVAGLSAGVDYSFDVIAVSGSQQSDPSNVVEDKTAPATSGGCTVNSINVTPASPVIDTSGNPVNFTSLSVTVQATAGCTNLSVLYGLNGRGGYPDGSTTGVPLTYTSGSFTGSASQTTWSAATYGFVVYDNNNATTAQANVTPCQEKGTTGSC